MCRLCHTIQIEDRAVLQRIITITGDTYLARSTVIVVPTREGRMMPRSEEALRRLIRPLNARSYGLKTVAKSRNVLVNTASMEVAHAYNAAFARILGDPDLSRFQYVLTFEADMVPPAEGLLKLFDLSNRYDVVQALYYERRATEWIPMVFGHPGLEASGFEPFEVQLGRDYPMHGCAMGFTLFKMQVLKDSRVGPPWCKSVEGVDPQTRRTHRIGQDIYLSQKLAIAGYKIGLSTHVLCGHKDHDGKGVLMGPWGGEPRVIDPEPCSRAVADGRA